MRVRKATTKDYDLIDEIGDKSFGSHSIREEIRLILEKGFGDIFLCYEKDKPVAYLALLYKEFDEKVESVLQPLISSAKEKGESIFHDDVRFDENKYVYLHLLGVMKGSQGKGIATKLVRYIKGTLEEEHPNKQLKTCIRINNLPSIKVCMKELGFCMVGMKPNNWDMHGSVETNFNGVTNDNLKPVLSLENTSKIKYKVYDERMPSTERFLLPVSYGDEEDLKDGKIKTKVERIFKEGYVIIGLFKASEFDLDGDSYFYCVKK